MSNIIPFKKSRREREIEGLDKELVELERQRLHRVERNERVAVGSEAERCFYERAAAKDEHEIHRGGWPDFLLASKVTGKLFGVEVKSETDLLSRGQVKCFAMLEKAGIPIYVWQPRRPAVLAPWRTWFKASKGYRSRQSADRGD